MEFKGHKEYTLIDKVILDDLSGIGYRLEHNKTKARVALIDCKDDNKVFTIGFRTPPCNDTGVPHIMEHSVLCGSKNFPVKDPFVELAKGSLNTFLNAMTYPDKTVYPVASRNDKDFQNLMHIYLDAVFYPNIYKYDEIFRQEGWNYTLENKDDNLKYNGVVYNEMKGAFSSPDGVLEREVLNSLFPNNAYGKESGGHPDAIPELTYEEFLDFHKKYYHPSNSYIYLYGDMDFSEKLDFIHNEYLNNFDYLEVDSSIPMENTIDKMIEVEKDYPVTEEKDNATYYSYNKVISSNLDKKTVMAFEILDYALISSPGAPLEKALIEAGVGEDVSGYLETDLLQPFFSITAKNGPSNMREKFVSTIEDTLKDIVKNGLNKKSLLAGIASQEFEVKEGDFGRYPKGLMYGLRNFSSWLYDDSKPFMYSDIISELEWLRDMVQTDYFEKLIEKYLLNNNHGSLVTINPVKGLESKRTKQLEDKLESIKSSLTEEELLKIIDDTKNLKEYQNAPSAKDDMDKIPVLKRSDIDKEEKKMQFHIKKGEINYVIHDEDTFGIDHVKLYFPINHIKHEDFIMLGILVNCIGMIDMENYTYNEMATEVNLNTGGVVFGLDSFGRDKECEKTYFSIKGKALDRNLDKLISIYEEVILRSKFDNYKRLDEIMAQMYAKLQGIIMSAGHVAATKRAFAHFSSIFTFRDMTDGIELYRNINQLRENLSNDPEKFVSKLKELLKKCLNTKDMVVSLAGSSDSIDKAKTKVEALINKINDNSYGVSIPGEQMDTYTIGKLREGFGTSSKVNYVGRCGMFNTTDNPYKGSLNVLKTMLAYDYLWNNIRVLGGAYGCMSNFTMSGFASMVTYRDPHLKRSMDIFEALPEYLRNLELDEDSLTKFVIGTMSSYDAPETPSMKIASEDVCYLSGVTDEMRQSIRNDILNITNDDLRKLADYIDEVLNTKSICVIGSIDKINEYKDMFDEIITL